MQFSKFIKSQGILIILIPFFTLIPKNVFAYRSHNTSIIGVKQKNSLLDRNYIFDHMLIEKNQAVYSNSSPNLEKLSSPISKTVSAKKPKQVSVQNNKVKTSSPPKLKAEELELESDWSAFKEELEEDLAVKARIL